MNHEPCGPPAAVTRPSRARTALSTAVPIALAIGAVFAAPRDGCPRGHGRSATSIQQAGRGLCLANGTHPACIGSGLGRCRRRQVA